MNSQTHARILQIMHPYFVKGTNSGYKKKQRKRLIAMLDSIMAREGDQRLEAIGKRQIIRHWKSIEHEKESTRDAKYSILNIFFYHYNTAVSVPKPKK